MSSTRNYALWTIQGLLARLFLFTGGMKLGLPIAAMTRKMPPPDRLLRIRQELTPLAAAGLAVIMIGATALTLSTAGAAPALMPLITGILAAFVAYGRWAPARSNPTVSN